VIYGLVPVSHHKLLNNMRKSQQRKERRKAEMSSETSHTADDDWPRKRKHDTYVIVSFIYYSAVTWFTSCVRLMYVPALCWACLVLGWVTVFGWENCLSL